MTSQLLYLASKFWEKIQRIRILGLGVPEQSHGQGLIPGHLELFHRVLGA